MAISDKLTYLNETKNLLKTQINYGLPTEQQITSSTTFRNYVSSIFNAFLEALRTPDTLFTNLPKKSGSGANITLNDTANAPMRIELGASELTQYSENYITSSTRSGNILYFNSATTTTDYIFPAGTYTISFTNSNNPSVYVRSANTDSTSLGSGSPKTITMTEPFNVWLYRSGMTDNETTNIKLLSNAPSPTTPQDIHTISGSNKVVIKGNLFDGEYRQGAENSTVSTAIFSKNDLVLEAGTYTFSCNLPMTSFKYAVGTNNSAFPGTATWLGGGFQTNQTLTFTLTETKHVGILVMKTDNSNISPSDISSYQFMLNVGNQATTYTPYTSQEADIDLVNPNNLIGLTTERCPVDLKAGDKITVGNLTSTQVVFNTYANRGDTTRNDYWTIQTSQRVRTITLAYDTKEIAWTTTPDNIIWINKGETLLPYEEYYNYDYSKISTYEDKFIRTSGKNLFDGEIELGSINPANGTTSSDNTRTRSKNFIKVKPNTTYSITRQTGQNRWIVGYTSSKVGITDGNVSGQASALLQLTNNVMTGTFTTTSTTEYIKWYDTNSTDLTEQVMINLGSTALPYEPYGSNEWYIKKNIGKVVLDGSESWLYDTAGGFNRFSTLLQDAFVGTGRQICLSNYFTNNLTTNADGICFIVNQNVYLYKNDTTTVADFKTWLSTHNTEVYYILATPTYTQITGTLANQLENVYKNMLSQAGQTNISQVNNDLAFNMSVQAIEE